jgi:NAD(P)-dependent dehydrogenase (short-subunit alcohol dehydrogenase family)
MAASPELKAYLDHVPLRRPGHEHEIAGPVLFLASPAGGYIDGAVINVDGGREMVGVLFSR